MLSPASFIDLCERMLRLCEANADESIAVVSQGDERRDYVEAFLGAAERIGATSFHLRLPSATLAIGGDVGVWKVGATPLAGNRPAIEALKHADLVVDTMFIHHSIEQVEILDSGTRIITVVEPEDLLVRLFPTDETTRLTQRGVDLISEAAELRFTNPAGTDVTYKIDTYPATGQFGFSADPGHWDHWPSSGMAYAYGDDDGVNGKIVVAPGDVLLPFKKYAQSPIEFTIENGRIQAIEGGVDAEIVREYLANFDDPNAYGMSHVGWGMNPHAHWTALATDTRGHGMELRAFEGNVMFSTGPNTQVKGPNNTEAHTDIVMRDCSLFLDDRPIVVDGELQDIVKDQAAAPA